LLALCAAHLIERDLAKSYEMMAGQEIKDCPAPHIDQGNFHT
jgi:hypothetical protein